MTVCTFLTVAEHRAREGERRAAVSKWQDEHPENDLQHGWPPELVALNDLFFPPGSMHYCPWYHDPSKEEDLAKVDSMIRRMQAEPERHWHLSIHYWRDWARIRPPIEVVCPGGIGWCPDQGSSNGDGWTVTGEVPLITCTPSIWAGQGKGPPREYHGFLTAGVFSPPV